MADKTKGLLLVLAAGVLWGANGLYVNVLQEAGLGPWTTVFVRYASALVMMLPLVRCGSRRLGHSILAVESQCLACCVAMGLASNVLGGVLCALTVARVGVSTMTVLLYTAPVFGCLLSWRLFGEPLERRKVASIACDFCGVLLVVLASGGLAMGGVDWGGVAFGLMYGLTYSLVAVLSRPLVGRCHPLSVVFYGTATVVLALAVPALGSGELGLLLLPLPACAALLYGALSTVVANMMYQHGMGLGVEASQAAVITSVEVASSAVLSTVLLHEPLGPTKATGIVLVLASIAIMNLGAPAGEVHGVRPAASLHALSEALQTSNDLSVAVTDLRIRRERGVMDSQR